MSSKISTGRKNESINSRVKAAGNYFARHSKSKTYTGHKKRVNAVAWNCDGEKIASGSADKTVRVHQLDSYGTSSADWELTGHTDSVDMVAFHPNHPDILATTSLDKTVRIWDTRVSKSCHGVQTQGENINLAWRPDGNQIVVGSKDDIVSIIDNKKTPLSIVNTHRFPYEVNEMTWNETGKYFLMTTGNGEVDILQLPSWEKLHSVQIHAGSCYCIEMDPKGRYLATGGTDALVCLLDISELVCVRTFPRLDSPIRSLSFSHDGRFIASASRDHRIDVSDVASGRPIHTILASEGMNSIAWHPNKLLLAFAGNENHGRYAGSIGVFGYKHQ